VHRKLPSLNALRAFEAAARCGTMTAASAELCVTPGAISRQVRQLESELGTALFEGTKHKPVRTAAGSSLASELGHALDLIAAAAAAIRSAERATVDVACYSTFAAKWLIPKLYSFQSEHPEIEVRIATDDSVVAQLDEARPPRYDVWINAVPLATVNPSDLAQTTTHRLFRERMGPVLSPGLAESTPLKNLRALAGANLLQTRARKDAWQLWQLVYGDNSIHLDAQGSTYEHYYFTLQAAISGLGVCMAPLHLVADDVASGRLVAPFGFVESGYEYAAHTPTHRSRGVELFCKWLAQVAHN
jgi:LysR family transcriptional regulator, glycine cleavage system transcriptional activator